MALTTNEVLEQSRTAFKQWGDEWLSHARRNGRMFKERGLTFQDVFLEGTGKVLVLIAQGPSLEKQIETLKKYRGNVDVMCVDKAIGDLVRHDIIPDYVIICDAGIDYKMWCEPYLDKLKDSTLCQSVTANPLWAENWPGRIIFFVNKDNINTQDIYTKESGCQDMIPAGSNVGNSSLIFSSHVLGYDQYLLIGYDYCWFPDGSYYAFDPKRKGKYNTTDPLDSGTNIKRYWMKHMAILDGHGRIGYTSQNLLFSARWLADFYQDVHRYHQTEIYNCSGQGILNMPKSNFEKRLKRAGARPWTEQEKNVVLQKRAKQTLLDPASGVKGFEDFIKSHLVANVVVNYIPDEVDAWVRAS